MDWQAEVIREMRGYLSRGLEMPMKGSHTGDARLHQIKLTLEFLDFIIDIYKPRPVKVEEIPAIEAGDYPVPWDYITTDGAKE